MNENDMVMLLSAVILIMGIIIMALLYVIFRMSQGLQVSIPQEAQQLYLDNQKMVWDGLSEMAKRTSQTWDDVMVSIARQHLFPEQQKSSPPSAGREDVSHSIILEDASVLDATAGYR